MTPFLYYTPCLICQRQDSTLWCNSRNGARNNKEHTHEESKIVLSLNIRGHLISQHHNVVQVLQTIQSSNAGFQHQSQGNTEISRHKNGVEAVFYSLPASPRALLSKRDDSPRAIVATSPQQHQNVGKVPRGQPTTRRHGNMRVGALHLRQ